jgi:DNA-binding response OmpR family regulator/anti-anti-sigma regulatory factor
MLQPARESLVLIVDDTPANLGVLYAALSRERIEVLLANGGVMALDVATSEQPDLILLDVVMPDLDGFEVCRRLKADPRTQEIPVMFMTALGETSDRVHGFQVGAVDYITKPFQEGELLARIRTQLALRQMTRTLREQNLRLEEQIRERAGAEAARERLTAQLRAAYERLEKELIRREQAEATRGRLQEQIIAVQEARLRELSSPLIPITDRIVVMPLIGTIDAERAQQALQAVLEGAAARRAEFVILDITGVRAVDAGVAGTLVRMGDGLRLLGASTVITGVNPEVATTLVQLGVSLGRTATRGTLQDGIAHAMGASTGAPGRRMERM